MNDDSRYHMESTERYWTVGEIAGYMGVSRQTVDRWRLNEGLPHLKIGSTVRFPVSQVEKWLEKKTKDTTSKVVKWR